MSVPGLLSLVRTFRQRSDADLVDELHTTFTSNLLLLMAGITVAKNYLGSPLQCASASQFPGSWDKYAENFCWSEDTYFVQPDVHVATIQEQERYSPERKLSYYQWVPFFLLLQAACFRFPSFLWKCMSINSGLRVHEIVSRALDPANMEEPVRQRNLDVLSHHISSVLRFQRRIQKRNILVYKTFKVLNVTYSACFISYMYLVTKLLYMLNVIAQLYLMNKFLETDRYQWYGLAVIRDIVRGVQWESSGYFPRVRQIANIQKYSVQCVLVINIFNEKIFILLWFWYSILMVVTVLSFVYWFVVMAFPCFGRWYVSTNLELHENEDLDIKKNQKTIRKFVNEYLKQDGVFVLRMVSMHAGILFGTQLVMHLYKIFLEVYQEQRRAPKENHYESNIAPHLRRRQKRKDIEDSLEDVVTGSFVPGSPLSRRRASSSSSDSSLSDRKPSPQSVKGRMEQP